MSEDKPLPPAGWYDDPKMANTRRYWDGAKWTEHRQEAATSTPQATPASTADDPDAYTPRRGGRGWLIAGVVFIAIVVVGSILGNSGGSGSDGTDADTGTGSSTPSKYDQTWSKDYAHTSCDEWTNTMDPHQRFAAAADMLTGARNKGDGGTGLPEDALVKTIEQGLDNACVEPTSNLAEIGAALYLTERSIFRP